ncbi:MFS transporter [Streptomyces youssoufiensis]
MSTTCHDDITVDPTGSRSVPVRMPLRRTRNFRYLRLSRVLSVGGSSVTLVAMPVLVYQETKSPFLVSLVAASEALPYVLFGLLAGAVADRAHRRRLMVAADLLNCACVGSVPLAAALGALTPAHVLTAAFLSSTLYVFFDAAGYGLVPAAVGRAGSPRPTARCGAARRPYGSPARRRPAP